ncbi:MAG: DUF1592 domain-containing protein [Myxococcota bacterium]
MKRLIPILLICAACTGEIGEGGLRPVENVTIDARPPQLGDDALRSPVGLGYVPLRRLTALEAKLTLEQALNTTIEQRLFDTYWPLGEAVDNEDASPFDNDAEQQLGEAVYSPPESPLQAQLDEFSRRAINAMSDAEIDGLLPCTPSGPGDARCFETFLRDVGLVLLRHPLAREHVQVYRDGLLPEAVEANDFRVGARLALRALILDLEFFYHLEGTIRTDSEHVMRLNDYELASRLAFLLWGRGPDRTLLERVAAGAFESPDSVRAEATRMMADPRALGHIARVHAMWLGYDQTFLTDDVDLAGALRQESFKLVERVLFDTTPHPWTDLFTAEETYVTPRLAMHYGMGPIADEGWVRYDAVDPASGERAGLLSHGTFLNVGTNPIDSSPSARGNAVLRRLTCSEVIPPDVNFEAVMNVSRDPDASKSEWWNMVTQSDCQGCHRQMDYIGFGLENFDELGVYRERERQNDACVVNGEGVVRGIDFVGPAQLGAVLVREGILQACFLEHYFRYVVGREAHRSDDPVLATLEARFAENDDDFLSLVLELVSSEAFRHRVTEEN